MERYLIESPHTADECDQAVKEIHAAGYLHSFEWGCEDGVHAAWAMVDVENLEHARQTVPWMFRDRARFVRLVKYDIADKLHHAESGS
jgi:hypothetical protein